MNLFNLFVLHPPCSIYTHTHVYTHYSNARRGVECLPDDALGGVLVQAAELGRHVGQRRKAVGVQVLILKVVKNNRAVVNDVTSEPVSQPLYCLIRPI